MGKKDSNFNDKIKSGRLVFAALIAAFLFVGAFATYNLVTIDREYKEAQNEYEELRIYASGITRPYSPEDDIKEPQQQDENEEMTIEHEIMPDLSSINPDYIGWIRIDGTNVDYPVVQGNDNYKYLNTTFRGGNNSSGTIFMDTECDSTFGSFALLHGHNMRDGSMFGSLHHYLDDSFKLSHPEIIIFPPDETPLVYTVFAAKLTNISDTVFLLPTKEHTDIVDYFSAFSFSRRELEDSIDLLVLATCTENNRNERLLVMAYRKK